MFRQFVGLKAKNKLPRRAEEPDFKNAGASQAIFGHKSGIHFISKVDVEIV
jgi:hypothetical protein